MFPDAAERVIELGLWICEALLRVGGSPGAIIERLLEKEPADRYQTVEKLRDALYAALDDRRSATRTAA